MGDHAVDIAEQVGFLLTGEFREFTDASHPEREHRVAGNTAAPEQSPALIRGRRAPSGNLWGSCVRSGVAEAPPYHGKGLHWGRN